MSSLAIAVEAPADRNDWVSADAMPTVRNVVRPVMAMALKSALQRSVLAAATPRPSIDLDVLVESADDLTPEITNDFSEDLAARWDL